MTFYFILFSLLSSFILFHCIVFYFILFYYLLSLILSISVRSKLGLGGTVPGVCWCLFTCREKKKVIIVRSSLFFPFHISYFIQYYILHYVLFFILKLNSVYNKIIFGSLISFWGFFFVVLDEMIWFWIYVVCFPIIAALWHTRSPKFRLFPSIHLFLSLCMHLSISLSKYLYIYIYE